MLFFLIRLWKTSKLQSDPWSFNFRDKNGFQSIFNLLNTLFYSKNATYGEIKETKVKGMKQADIVMAHVFHHLQLRDKLCSTSRPLFP